MIDNTTYIERLKERLLIEFRKQDRSGVYGFMQRSMAYNSNRIEGSTLTERQTASMFETGTLYSDDPDFIFRAKDVEEMNGHFKMFNYVLKTIHEPLSNDMIKEMHRNLKEGVFEDFANGYAVGDWKQRANRVSDLTVALPEEVPDRMKRLMDVYASKNDITVCDIAIFHAEYENIHPFQDGNGRTGRMISLKQCLDHDIIPIIIRDINKAEYSRYLNKAQHEKEYEPLIRYFEKEQDWFIEQTVPMLFSTKEIEQDRVVGHTENDILIDDFEDDGYNPADD